MIGRYEVVDSPVSITDAAVIYKAVRADDRSESRVQYAVKQYAACDIPDRFIRREKNISVEIYNRLKNREAVIPITEIIEEDGKQYAVMQLKKHGKFLNELIREMEQNGYYGKGVLLQLDLIKEILISLESVHTCGAGDMGGYVHLDIHPGNIFFENTDIEKGQIGTVKFIDFLSAQPLDSDGRVLKKPDDIIASPVYAAPEYAAGNPSSICRATDLYSVGKVFCRMLLGRNMASWEEDDARITVDTVGKAAGGRIRAEILLSFLHCALDVNPDYRFHTAAGMMEEAERIRSVLGDCDARNYERVLAYLYDAALFTDGLSIEELGYDRTKLQRAAGWLNRAMYQDSIHSSKYYYIFSNLWRFLTRHKEESREYRIAENLLLASGIACCNHTGRSEQAMELFRILQSGSPDMPVSEYLSLINRIAVIYADAFDYQGAYDLISGNIAALEAVRETYRKIAAERGMDVRAASRVTDLARAYSAKGCYMTLLHMEKDEFGETPPDYFSKALDEFGDSIGNRRITISHMLHYAIEINDRELFEDYEKKYGYFRSDATGEFDKSLSTLLEELLEKGDAYVLYVYLKAVHQFYLREADGVFAETLRQSLSDQLLCFDRNHPMELVFRYVARILCAITGSVRYSMSGISEADRLAARTAAADDSVERAFYLAMTFVPEAEIDLKNPIQIFACITYQTMYQYHLLTNQKEENVGLYEDFTEHCRRSENHRLLEIYDKPEKLNCVLGFEYA
ncbi:MAG: hypothetical protein LUE14_07040 [Clostridiales bacterium]|nr:hypothetical protein [Clostridiales bacterium]